MFFFFFCLPLAWCSRGPITQIDNSLSVFIWKITPLTSTTSIFFFSLPDCWSENLFFLPTTSSFILHGLFFLLFSSWGENWLFENCGSYGRERARERGCQTGLTGGVVQLDNGCFRSGGAAAHREGKKGQEIPPPLTQQKADRPSVYYFFGFCSTNVVGNLMVASYYIKGKKAEE